MGSFASIIIPCYNAAAYVGDAIRSALSQTWARREIIVVDDGSTDGSLDVIKSFGGDIRWVSVPHAGGNAARNRGLREARGEWVQFLDADDILLPNCLEQKFRFAESVNHAICCEVAILTVDDHGANSVGSAFWYKHRWSLDFILAAGSPQTSAPLHRRAHLQHIGGFREALGCAQELDLHLRLAIAFTLEYASHGAPGVLIRPVPTSVSRNSGVKMPRAIAGTLINAIPLLETRGLLTSERKALIAQRLTVLAKKVWDHSMRHDAVRIANVAQQLSSKWPRKAYRRKTGAALAGVLGFERYEQLRSLLPKMRRRSGPK